MCSPKDTLMPHGKISEPSGPENVPVEDEDVPDNDDNDIEIEMQAALSQPIYSTGGDIVTILWWNV